MMGRISRNSQGAALTLNLPKFNGDDAQAQHVPGARRPELRKAFLQAPGFMRSSRLCHRIVTVLGC
eukprot:749372-Hanusia_phi.AAC.1